MQQVCCIILHYQTYFKFYITLTNSSMKKKLLLTAFAYLAALGSTVAINVNLNYIDDVCGQGSGRVWIQDVTAGLPPYTYLWSTSATTDSIYGLSAGTYIVTVTDAN